MFGRLSKWIDAHPTAVGAALLTLAVAAYATGLESWLRDPGNPVAWLTLALGVWFNVLRRLPPPPNGKEPRRG